MGKNRKVLYIAGLCTALAVGAFASPFSQIGASNNASQQDPIVTQSYVHLAIQQALSTFNPEVAQNSTFNPVLVPAGHVILGNEGTEIILRAGVAVAHVPTAEGIANITTGADLPQDYIIERNHLLIIPRTDGRGIRAITDTWFLVKGNYNIVILP
ncbi:MAG: hypothetical protein FWE44_02800 [Defluviitaleaceae bacterium]|nr:hypothetical protein [Defluviitaleaceae bacterium]